MLLRLLLACLRPVLTAPTVVLPPRLRLPHLLPPAKLIPAALSVGGNTSPSLLQLSPSARSDDGGIASLLRQGWVALASHRTPCPRSCSRRKISAAAVLPSFRRNTTLPACSHASTIRDFRRWCGIAPLHAAPAGGWRLMPTRLSLCLAFGSDLEPAHRAQGRIPISSWPMKLHRSLLRFL